MALLTKTELTRILNTTKDEMNQDADSILIPLFLACNRDGKLYEECLAFIAKASKTYEISYRTLEMAIKKL